jgi:hypothetical protein
MMPSHGEIKGLDMESCLVLDGALVVSKTVLIILTIYQVSAMH